MTGKKQCGTARIKLKTIHQGDKAIKVKQNTIRQSKTGSKTTTNLMLCIELSIMT